MNIKPTILFNSILMLILLFSQLLLVNTLLYQSVDKSKEINSNIQPLKNETITRERDLSKKTSAFSDKFLDLSGNQIVNSFTINSNSELQTMASSNGWSGTGSEYDPIIIEHYNFTEGNANTRLLIENIDLYLVVRYCHMSGPDNNTIVKNSTNILIKGNTMSNGYFGLFMSSTSQNNTIVYNLFENNNINANDNNSVSGKSNFWNYNYYGDHPDIGTNNFDNSGIFWNSYPINGSGNIYDTRSRVYKSSWNHYSIESSNDQGLANYIKQYGFLGNGTEDNPYIFENLNFTVDTEIPAIYLSRTYSHVIIRNCYFNGNRSYTAIEFSASDNIQIFNCTIFSTNNGINIQGSSNIVVRNVVISNTTASGLVIEFSNLILLQNITIYAGYNGIYINNGNKISFVNCTVGSSRNNGVEITNSNSTLFSNLFVNNSSFYSFNFNKGINLSIISSFFNGSDNFFAGVFIEDIQNLSVRNSIFKNAFGSGLDIRTSNMTLIEQCFIINNNKGFTAIRPTNMIINQSVISDNKNNGIDFSLAKGVTIDTANITNNAKGIYMAGTEIIVKDSLVTNNTGTGIDFPDSQNNIIRDTTISNSNIAILFSAYDPYQYNNSLIRCTIDNNTNGIVFENANFFDNVTGNVFTKDCLITNNNIGIYLLDAQNNTFIANNFISNDVAVNISKGVVNSTFIENEFINSTQLHAWDNSIRTNWNNVTHGNYWDDYTGNDSNHDGIGDTPYNIQGFGGATDQYPLFKGTSPTPAPIIELLSPLNASIVRSSTIIEFNITNSNGSMIYSWNSGSNTTILTTSTITFPSTDGIYTLELYVTNGFGNWTYKIYVFTIDNTEPVINPVDEITNGSEVGAGTTIPFNVFDTHFEEFWYYWNNSGGSSATEFTTTPYAEAPLITGEWTLNVYANDSAGNVAQFIITINVLTAASITILHPNGGEIVGGFVNITWESIQMLTYDLYYSPNNGTSWVKLAEDITGNHWVWNTVALNGSTFLVRVLSVTSGHPGEARSENIFSIFNLAQQKFPAGSSTIYFPDINITIILSEPTNVTIQRLTTVEKYMDPNASDFYSYGIFLDITLTNSDALETLIIKFDVLFLKNTLKQQGLSIYDVEVYFFNETSSQWEPADLTEYDIINWVITGHFNHTTTIGILGKSRSAPIGPGINPFFLLLVSLTIFAGVLGGGYYVYYQKKKR